LVHSIVGLALTFWGLDPVHADLLFLAEVCALKLVDGPLLRVEGEFLQVTLTQLVQLLLDLFRLQNITCKVTSIYKGNAVCIFTLKSCSF